MSMDTEIAIMIALIPFLAVWGLLALSSRVARARSVRVPRAIPLTPAHPRRPGGLGGVVARGGGDAAGAGGGGRAGGAGRLDRRLDGVGSPAPAARGSGGRHRPDHPRSVSPAGPAGDAARAGAPRLAG